MKNQLLGQVALIGIFFALPGAEAASFNCQRASTNIEKMICGNPEINEADERLAAVYKEASTSTDGEAVKSEQRAWLKSRNACSDETCLLALYRDRTLVLTATSRPGPAPASIPVVLTLHAQADKPAIEKTRVAKGIVTGYVEFGHDQAGGKYTVVESGGGQITLSYVWDISEQETTALETLQDRKIMVQVVGTLDVYSDGGAMFSRARPITIHHSAAPHAQANSFQQKQPANLVSCVLDTAGLSDWGRNVYIDLLTELKREESGAQFIMGSLCDSAGSPLAQSRPIFANTAAQRIDDSAAATWYLKAASQGHANAQLRLCQMYIKGRGVSKDVDAATGWCRKAAAQDVYAAQAILKEIGADNLRMRAEQGNPDAQNDLAVEYQKSKKFELAAQLFRKAAEQGSKVAQFNLGLCFEQGLGVSEDAKQAAEWHLKSAEQGYAAAQERLGAFYTEGKGVLKDLQKAAEWNRKAGAQGRHRAQAAYESYVTDRAYADLVASVADRFKLPKSAHGICLAGVSVGNGAPIMVPEYMALLAEGDKMLERIVYEEPGLFGGEYTLSFKRRADQHDQIKAIFFKMVFIGENDKVYINQTPGGDLNPCLIASRADFIGGRTMEIKGNLEGSVLANLLVNELYPKLRSKAHQKALAAN